VVRVVLGLSRRASRGWPAAPATDRDADAGDVVQVLRQAHP
jgi:hypothetical protein